MPELPEVEVIRAGMTASLVGAQFTDIAVLDARALRRDPEPVAAFVTRLAGTVVTAVLRRGKVMWIPLGAVHGPEVSGPDAPNPDGQTLNAPAPTLALVLRLGMSGQVLLHHGVPDPIKPRHLRVRFRMTHPTGPATTTDFVDQRTFGGFHIAPLVDTPDGGPGGWSGPGDPASSPPPSAVDRSFHRIPASLLGVARDPLDPAFNERAFRTVVARSRTAIKSLLLDQSRLSGVGNIYADEALWAARIHPQRPAAALAPAAVTRLLTEIRAVFRRALDAGGTSFDALYVNVNGASGYFSRSLAVYGQTGRPCRRCGTPIERLPFAGRSSHVCPRCQRV